MKNKLLNKIGKGITGLALLGGLTFAIFAPTTERFGYSNSVWNRLNRNFVQYDFLHWHNPLLINNCEYEKILLEKDEPCPEDRQCIIEKGTMPSISFFGGGGTYYEIENPKRYYFKQTEPLLKELNISYDKLKKIVLEYEGPAHYGKLKEFVEGKVGKRK